MSVCGCWHGNEKDVYGTIIWNSSVIYIKRREERGKGREERIERKEERIKRREE